jgi:hypothetical protein
VFGERRELEAHAPRIGLVDHQEVDERRGLEHARIPVAVGHRAVGDLEEHLVEP